MVRQQVNRNSIVPARNSANCGMRFTCAITRHSRRFAAALTDYWSAANPSTNSSASIYAGPIRSDRCCRPDEKIMISGALTLLTNAVITYDTWKLNQVL